MNTREKIITEMEASAPFSKDEFMDEVSRSLIDNGEFAFIVDAQCSDNTYTFDMCPTFPVKWLPLIRTWVENAGLHLFRQVSAWGVPEYIITL